MVFRKRTNLLEMFEPLAEKISAASQAFNDGLLEYAGGEGLANKIKEYEHEVD
jgi:uncharacterized protein Yka (UPF0111/DUF47 family)